MKTCFISRMLCCTICIFLCATPFAEAANDSDRDLLLEAALQERAVWNAATPSDANSALIRKAALYAQAGLWSDAAGTTGRVRMYLLSEEERRDLLISKEYYLYMSGDLQGAAAVDAEIDANDSEVHALVEKAIASQPRSRNPQTAMLLSLIPGLGQFYAGGYKEGVLSIGLNACSILWTITQITSGCYVSGIVGGAIALNMTYLGGIQQAGMIAASRQCNYQSNPAPER